MARSGVGQRWEIGRTVEAAAQRLDEPGAAQPIKRPRVDAEAQRLRGAQRATRLREGRRGSLDCGLLDAFLRAPVVDKNVHIY